MSIDQNTRTPSAAQLAVLTKMAQGAKLTHSVWTGTYWLEGKTGIVGSATIAALERSGYVIFPPRSLGTSHVDATLTKKGLAAVADAETAVQTEKKASE